MANSDTVQTKNLHRHAWSGTAPVRVSIHRWGFSEQEAQGILTDCTTMDGKLAWALADRHEFRADVIVHLIDATNLAGEFGGALWNAMGPVQAMRAASQTGTLEVALVLGNARHLPTVRAGCWIMAGSRSLASALAILFRSTVNEGELVVASRERLKTLRELASLDATCMLLQQCDAGAERLADKIGADLVSLADASYAVPSWISIGAPEPVLAAFRRASRKVARRLRFCVRRSDESCADVVVAFPWPDLVRNGGLR